MEKLRNSLMTIALVIGTVMPTTAWADTWDGVTYTKPQYNPNNGAYDITCAAELAYVQQHFTEESGRYEDNVALHYYEENFYMFADIDMGDNVLWTPIGNNNGDIQEYKGIFWGLGKTLRIHISGATENYQGLFAKLGAEGSVKGLYLEGKIECTKSRLVGGICGENYGTIRNCAVKADVSSDWREASSAYTAKVGGICGENHGTIRYCIMTGIVKNDDADVGGLVGHNNGGTIEHCTLYGKVVSSHSQDNVWVGDQGGTTKELHGDDLLDDEALSTYIAYLLQYATNQCYNNTLENPYSISVQATTEGSLSASASTSRPTKTITLTPAADNRIAQIMVCDADGNQLHRWICPQEASYTFTMPRRNVIVTVTNIPWQGHGTADDPYLISTADDWDNLHALLMQMGTGAGATEECFKGMHFRQTADLDITQGIGVTGEGHNAAFAGTYDGSGHKLRCNITNPVSGSTHPVAPFYMVRDATLRNIYVTGTISGGIHSAGLVAWTSGTTEVEDCRVSADISCTDNGLNLAHGGGIVGHAYDSRITVRSSMFDGTLRVTAGDGDGARLGAIIGWGGTETSVSDCLECGTFVTSGQTAFCWKDSGLGAAEIDIASGNKYVSALTTPVANTYRLYPVKSGTEGLVLNFSDGNWKAEYLGGDVLRNDVYNQNNYQISGTFYALEGNTVQFQVSYPNNWKEVDICYNDVPLGKADHDATYTFTQGATSSSITAAFPQLTLADNADNQPTLYEYGEAIVNVRIEGRTLYRDGTWNTLCLPFALNSLTGTPLEGATVKSLASTSLADGVLTLNFSDENHADIEAGRPYIVKWTSGQTLDNVVNPEFAKVTIDHTLRPYDDERVGFYGTFDPFITSVEDRSMLYLGANNTLYYPSPTSADNPVIVGSFRAYFRLASGLTAGDATSTTDPSQLSITSFKLNFGGEETAIRSLTPDASSLSDLSTPWYTLSGQRLGTKPSRPGLYIHEGRKVMIK